MLSTKVKTHYILIKEGDRGGVIKKIALTKAEYELYEQELEMKKHNGFFKMYDIDTQELLFNGRANKVEGFEEIKIDSELQQATFTCSFGTKHNINMGGDCDCSKKYDTLGILFIDKIKELGYNINYNKDITKEMQEHYLRVSK